MRFFMIFPAILIFLIACEQKQDDLLTLRDYLSGSFSSKDQAAGDSAFLDIRLEMVPIWKDRTDGYWLYVEQAAAENLAKPYRQRVYQLTRQDDSTFVSVVYTLPDPQRFAGAWKESSPLETLTPDSLVERAGCAILLTKYGSNMFVGSTAGLGCDSDLRGATYATSIVIVSPDQLYSWDRGYDINGNQVWGAAKGGYVFKKVASHGSN